MSRPPHRLSAESRPRLLQPHSGPVDWSPWGHEALARAQAEQRPILLWVGASAGPQSHAMERECFEYGDTAEMMNARFVNVKVDREERPDLDELATEAIEALRHDRGGWPVAVFLTPDGVPFFGGTPPSSSPGPRARSFRQHLAHVHQLWTTQRDEVERAADDVRGVLQRRLRLPDPEPRVAGWTETVARAVAPPADRSLDASGGAPGLASPATLDALLMDWHLRRDPHVRTVLTRTLDALACGGGYDLLGGGFVSASADGAKRVLHYEKTLYDNAQLVPLFVDAARAFDTPRWARVAEETCDAVLRELTLDEGGVCTARGGTRNGPAEGYFAWTPAQLRQVLGPVAGARAADLLQVTAAGTFAHGTSVLRLDPGLEQRTASETTFLRAVLPRLETARDGREQPARDDRVITSRAALMVRAWAIAGTALGAPRFVRAAERAATFIEHHLVVGGRLRRTWRAGRAPSLAFADDHAALVRACVALFEATGALRWLDRAVHWADALVALFWDDTDRAFSYSGHDAPALGVRSQNPGSEARPGANGLAAVALAQLATLTGRADLAEHADAVLSRCQPLVDRRPHAVGLEAVAAAWRTEAVEELALLGKPGDTGHEAMRRVVAAAHRPLMVVAPVAPRELAAAQARIPWLVGRHARPGHTKAYLCRGGACHLPVQSAAALAQQLAAEGARSPKSS